MIRILNLIRHRKIGVRNLEFVTKTCYQTSDPRLKITSCSSQESLVECIKFPHKASFRIIRVKESPICRQLLQLYLWRQQLMLSNQPNRCKNQSQKRQNRFKIIIFSLTTNRINSKVINR